MGVQRYTVGCYRKASGDADRHDVPAFGEDYLEGIVEPVGFLLLAYFSDQRRPAHLKPATADIENGHEQIVARIRVVGPDKIERIAN